MGPWTTSEGEKHSISCCQETHTKSVGQSGRGRACGETVENTEWPCGAGTGQARARPAAERENRHLLWQAGTGTLPRSCLSVSSGPSCHGCHHPFFFCPAQCGPRTDNTVELVGVYPNRLLGYRNNPGTCLPTSQTQRSTWLECMYVCARSPPALSGASRGRGKNKKNYIVLTGTLSHPLPVASHTRP